jgi:hypothetical protein
MFSNQVIEGELHGRLEADKKVFVPMFEIKEKKTKPNDIFLYVAGGNLQIGDTIPHYSRKSHLSFV